MVVIYVILGVFASLAILTIIAPADFRVEEKVVINKPRTHVFNYLKYLKNQIEWSSKPKIDPDVEFSFKGEDGKAGFVCFWDGNKEVGSGEQEIINIKEGKAIKTVYRSKRPWKYNSLVSLKVEELSPDETEVIWEYEGKDKVPFSILLLSKNIRSVIANEFKQGLSQLKARLEDLE